MFAQRPDIRPATVDVFVAGQPVRVPEGATAAAAVLLAGLPAIRETPVTGSPRLPYCMMGVCFDCLVVVNGVPGQRACLVRVSEGDAVTSQEGHGHGALGG